MSRSATSLRGALATVCACVVVLGFAVARHAAAQDSGAATKATELRQRLQKLQGNEWKRLQTIVGETAKSPTAPTADTKKEFRSLLAVVAPTSADVDAVHDFLLAAIELRRLVFQDGEQSLKAGKAVRSPEREAYEKRLQALGGLTDAQIAQSQETVEKIARSQPIANASGQTATLDGATLHTAAMQLAEAKRRVDVLFAE